MSKNILRDYTNKFMDLRILGIYREEISIS